MSRAVDKVSEEIAQAKAEALGLAGRMVEQALRELHEHDEGRGAASAGPRRAALLARAADRVLNYIVQREAQGFRDPHDVLEHFAVPREVVARIGIRAR